MPTDISSFFGKKKDKKKKPIKRALESSSKPEPKRPKTEASKEVIDLDDEGFSDSEIIEIDQKPSVKKSEPKEIKKPAPVKKPTALKKPTTPRKPTTPKNPTSTISGQNLTAEEVLAKIPDCQLPDVEPGAKVNFWAKKPEQETDSSFLKPEGKEQCLAGLTIVFTGILPHLNRDDCEYLAKKYGAKVTKSISKKTSLVVLGDDAGPSKVTKIKSFKIRHIDEDGFCELIKGAPEAGGDSEAAKKAIEKAKIEEEKIESLARQEALQAETEEKSKKKKLLEAERLRASNPKASLDTYVNGSQKSDDEKLWTTKYAPSKLSQICGNKGPVTKIHKWLSQWHNIHGSKRGFTYSDTSFPAVLISGPPGIGKTTAAHIIAKDLGYEIIEKNASDVRSKSFLNSTIKDVLDNTSVVGFFQHNKEKASDNKKLCLIMDEVDGMSSGDHGGVGALSAFCRKTAIPMILICNDKSSPKMRPFDRVTMDAQFRKPEVKAIKSRVLTICLREGLKVPPEIIDRLIEYTKNDIRQIINLLSTVSRTVPNIDNANFNDVIKGWEKNVAMKTFDITNKYLNAAIWNPSSKVTIKDKLGYYFDDYAFVPLMIHENYMMTNPTKSNGNKLKSLELVSKAAESISLSDLVDRKIRSAEQQWSLMPLHALMSSVLPSSYVHGLVTGRTNFTSFLGNLSKTNKFNRLLVDLNYHAKLRTLTNKAELRMNYLNLFARKLSIPLTSKGVDGIPEVIEVLDEYYFTKEDWEYILDFGVGASKFKFEVISKKLPTPVKTAFTRKYNAMQHPTAIYHVGTAGTSRKGVSNEKPDLEEAVDDDAIEDKDDDNEEEEQDIKKDKLIKQKKATTKKAKKPATKRATKKK